MQRYHQKYMQVWSRLVAAIAFIFNLLLPQVAISAPVTSPLDLATIPLANSPTITIQPNLLFVLDDSGSMSWDYMPDWANSSNDSQFRNASYNTVAYNPSVSYLPPVFFDSSGLNTSQYPSQIGQATATGASTATKPNWRQVKNNAYTGSGYPTGTKNLETDSIYFHVVAGEYCTKRDLKVCNAQSAPSATYPYPATVRWCNTSGNAGAATPAANSCQATNLTGFTNLRMPSARVATISVANGSGGSTSVSSVTVGGAQILSATTASLNNNNNLASAISTNINNCTYALTGSCTARGYFSTVSGSVVTVYASPTAATANITSAPVIIKSGGRNVTSTAFSVNAVPGKTLPVVISASLNSYTLPGSTVKAASRTDCAGATCTYVEEMTNYANWHTYYGTRGQAMKTSASIAFKDVTEDYRLGFMTTSTRSAQMLNFDTFNTAQKAAWYSMFFAAPADRNTPLRGSLSKAGRIYANETVAKRGVFTDPIQYECQQNFTLLTTDGYWNTGDETSTYAGGPLGLDNTNVGNLDSAANNTPRPMREGSPAVENTLADVAKYYFDTDIRTVDLGNCTGAKGENICQSPAPSTANQKQNMVTLTLGMGVDGVLSYTSDYKIATSGDFTDIKNGIKNWPDPIANTGPERIDDLWHAAVNGGGTYFSAKNPTDLVSQLKEALASIEVKLGAGSAAATSTLNPVTGDNNAYVASYTSGYWIGNLEKRSIDLVTGAVSQAASACVEDVVTSATCISPSSVVPDGSGAYNCVTPSVTSPLACSGTLVGTDCSVSLPVACVGTLKDKVANTADTRKIYMNSGGALTDFTLGAISSAGLANTFGATFLAANLTQWPTLTSEQKANFTSERLVNYLRGQTGYDENAADPENKLFRKRQAVLGDAVDSKPAFVGKPTFKYADTGYSAFKEAQATRTKTVFMGANDGMLHAFDAGSLQELWAYVPSMVIPNMWKLADSAYGNKHSYYVNGDPVISDVYDGGAWRTILVAGLNGGGRGYYALDITNPTSPTLLWEFDAVDEPNLGYTYGTPIITKKSDGTWVVLVTSGYNNIPDNSAFYSLPDTKFKPNNPALYNGGDGKGYLYVLNAISGTKVSEIPTGVGSTSLPSGLAEISAYADDPEKNNTATYVYGGDLLGNLWRFNLADNSKLLFAKLEASGAQAITTSPELGTIKNKRVVFVGTGKYLEVSDLTDTSQQTLYAIKDDNASATLVDPRSVLVEQTIVPDSFDTRKSGTSNAVDFGSGLGWYIDLPDQGERQNVPSQLVLGTLLVPTTVPTSSACQPAGYGWLTFLDYETGTAVNNLGANIVSLRTNAPTVGFNVVYIDGKPKVSIVTADNPTPQILDVPFTGTGTGFQKHRSIWRELNL
ncbi:MAG: PilC/PilY family type IV pilus protein [Methylotenera sp.]|uniref:pilus assembly protein n=1 Tax=Methylotenera sp. TaxID=2051956 RepID=UPI00271FF94A|nr:PilC/PilY family type IV pilus protein [Methylotenera sp.]MDO9151863.1 PilC/PilY family type IV pilus protein [Methylotenera sp.]